MPAALEHVVVTNVSAPVGADAPAMDDERVWYLLGFFLDACLPSVQAQEPEHTWLVWFDDRCAPDLRAEVERIAVGAFTPVWSRTFDAGAVAAAVARHTSAPWVATTLVDCDDAMARDCLAAVAEQHDGQGAVLVTFPDGLTIDRTGGVFATEDAASPVRALVAARPDGGQLPTILDAPAEVRRVSVDRPMWIDVDHEPAEVDPARGRRLDPAVVAERFAIDLAYQREVSTEELRGARRDDLRRRGRHLLRDRKLNPLAERAVQGVRSLGWMRHAAVNAAADRVQRRSAVAGLTPVAGPLDVVAAGERVAVLAEFCTGPRVRPWALTMAGALAESGYPTVIVCARDRGRAVDAPADLPPGVAVVSRANARYDFGSWAAALEAWPHLTEARHVLLTNDSIIGPLTGRSTELARLLTQGESDPAQVFAATRGRTGADHLQAYFLLFSDGVLGHPALQEFFASLPFSRDRADLVRRYEHGLTDLLRREGITHGAAWDHTALGVAASANPYLCWEELFDAGFPFLKRRLLTHPRFATVRPIILAHVRDRYGVDLT